MLQNAYFLAKIGADTAENEQQFAEILPIGRRVARIRPWAAANTVRGAGLGARVSKIDGWAGTEEAPALCIILLVLFPDY